MANKLYPKYAEAILSGSSNSALAGATVKVALIDTDVRGYNAADQFYSDMSAAVVGTPQTLGSLTVTGGVVDASDSTFPSVPSGEVLEALIIYIDTGSAGTSRLVAYIDSDVTGLPINPNGSDIDVTWNALGIFSL